MNRANALLALWVAPVWVGLSACQSPEGNIRVSNLPPTAEFQSPLADDALLFQGIPETFRGHVQDPDGQPDELVATFLSGDQELCPPATPTANGEVFCDITLPAGPTQLRLAVVDRGGLSGFASDTYWARPSAEPNAEILQPLSADQFFADQIITFEGNVDDVEDDPAELTAWWSSNIDGDLTEVDATPNANGTVNGVGFLTEGDHQIRLNVEDRAGNISFDATVIRVGPANRPPACGDITNPIAGSVNRFGSPLIFSASVDDPDVPNNFIDITWESDQDGELAESTPGSDGSITYVNSNLSRATHVITMTAEDSFGQSCTSSIIIVIGSPPAIEVTSPQRNAVYQADTPVDFIALATDEDDVAGNLTVTWVDDVEGELFLITPNADGTMDNSRTMTPGPHLLTVTVEDLPGLETQVQIPYSVNAVPGGPGIELGPEAPITSDDITATVTSPSIDPDGDTVTYTYEWRLDGIVQFGETAATVPAARTTRGDEWTVYVTPTDGFGTGPTASLSVTVGKTPPVAGNVQVTGGPFFETSTLTCTAAAGTDDDGDPVTYTYNWTVNNEPIPGNTQTLDGSRFDRDDVVACVATPNDGLAGGAPRTSSGVTILNTPPRVDDPVVGPAGAQTFDTLTCAATYSDDDTDASQSTYEWTSNSSVLGTGPTLNTDLEVGQQVQCTITANDGTTDGNSVSASVTIRPSAPTIDGVTVGPQPAFASTALTCNYTNFSDPQGDPDQSLIQWFVNGSAVAQGASLASGFGKGDTVRCDVTPSDGSNQGASRSASVTVQNSVPTRPTVRISPDFPLSGLDDLVCGFAPGGASSDGDPEDTVTYAFTWNTPNGPYNGADNSVVNQSRVPSSDFAGSQEWTCTVTPTDGTTFGPAGSDTVTTIPSIAPKVAVSSIHSCLLDRRGEVTCWGNPNDGRRSVPNSLFVDVDGANDVSCGLTDVGDILCWGPNDANNLAIPPPGTDFVDISLGTFHGCAIRENGSLVCWGANDFNMVNAAPTTGTYATIAAGGSLTCATRAVTNTLVCWGRSLQGSLNPPSGAFRDLSVGLVHACAIRISDDQPICWGANDFGQLNMPANTPFDTIATGRRHTCGVRASDGQTLCYGFNESGRATPVAASPGPYEHLDMYEHTCGIQPDGRARCWGPNGDNQSSPP